MGVQPLNIPKKVNDIVNRVKDGYDSGSYADGESYADGDSHADGGFYIAETLNFRPFYFSKRLPTVFRKPRMMSISSLSIPERSNSKDNRRIKRS